VHRTMTYNLVHHFVLQKLGLPLLLLSFPTRRSSDLYNGFKHCPVRLSSGGGFSLKKCFRTTTFVSHLLFFPEKGGHQLAILFRHIVFLLRLYTVPSPQVANY